MVAMSVSDISVYRVGLGQSSRSVVKPADPLVLRFVYLLLAVSVNASSASDDLVIDQELAQKLERPLKEELLHTERHRVSGRDVNFTLKGTTGSRIKGLAVVPTLIVSDPVDVFPSAAGNQVP